MPEWLQTLGMGPGVTSWEQAAQFALSLVAHLGLACVLGWLVAAVYRLTRRGESVAHTFPPTLVLLTVLIAMVTQVIGDNVARAFSLVGALSIVRFRTVVEDTHDIAFVIFAVVVGMAVGANHLLVAFVGLAVVGTAAILVQPRRQAAAWSEADARLTVRLAAGLRPEDVLSPVFDRYLTRHELTSGSTGRQGAALDFTYRVRLRAGVSATELVEELNRREGIQSVELNRT
ncbi:MAG: DUF4956 domain-containing protein [Pirellulales bacterium]|nr:DUF4956 domain-containing protein [Pirellulales bacterium]